MSRSATHATRNVVMRRWKTRKVTLFTFYHKTYHGHVEVTPDAVGLPAAFVRKGPGYANAHRAWKVVVQGAHGQSRVRAVSSNGIRVDETPPANWGHIILSCVTSGEHSSTPTPPE